jgi:hypothetical protein
MGFMTEDEKMRTRYYLGYSATDPGYITIDSVIESYNSTESRSKIIKEILGRLDKIELEMMRLHESAIASTMGDAELNPKRYSALKHAGMREVTALSSYIGIPIANNIFASGWTGGYLKHG